MANWCSNTVVFEASKTVLKKLEIYFNRMAKKELKEKLGQLPDFKTDDSGYLFSIRWEEGVLYFETKWGPNADVIKAIADHFKTDFIHSYDEPMMQVYGEVHYKDSTIRVIELENEDYDLFDYDEEKETYFFENNYYDSEYEILDILMDRKKQAK
jgi:hypothetical protein